MRKSRLTTEQIIGFIKQAEAGMAVSELGRQHGFSRDDRCRTATSKVSTGRSGTRHLPSWRCSFEMGGL